MDQTNTNISITKRFYRFYGKLGELLRRTQMRVVKRVHLSSEVDAVSLYPSAKGRFESNQTTIESWEAFRKNLNSILVYLPLFESFTDG